jgi:3D (Asp-Asp-Asp) domain-containing protein
MEVRTPVDIAAKIAVVGLAIGALVWGALAERDARVPLDVTPHLTVRAEPYPAAALPELEHRPGALPSLTLRATGYNSLAAQTDSTPHITATGTRTRFGVVAVSRDLLGDALPYGSLVRLTDLGGWYDGRGAGRYQSLLDGQDLFVVEDTMHARKTQQVDVWFGDYASAVNWGVRQVVVEVVRYGYDGPILDPRARAPFDGRPILTAQTR